MDAFNYRNGQLYAEKVALAEVAQRFGTPCYVYSRAAMESAWQAFDQALGGYPHLICYAVVAGALGVRASVALRINPDVDPKTYPYISTGLNRGRTKALPVAKSH